MSNLFRRFLRRHVIDTVPDAIDQCLLCSKPRCTLAEFHTCLPRLDRAAALEAARRAPGPAWPLPAAAASPGEP